MKKRYLEKTIESLALKRDKMAFISGPRQCGKTTLAQMLLKNNKSGAYYNWDDIDFRRQWTKSPNKLVNKSTSNKNKVPFYIFDEIHKAKGWKRTLKGIYDTSHQQAKMIVTGSARLNIYKKGGDSLLGRYLNFRLHPFSLGELTEKKLLSPNEFIKIISTQKKQQEKSLSTKQKRLNELIRYGGFPESIIAKSDNITRLWQRGRAEKIVREDLRDLSRLPELSQIEMLMSLLPEKVSSLLSIQSLREDLEVAHTTVSRWLKYLSELYYFYEIKPWSKSIPRSLKKEGKIYLWDWSEVPGKGAQYENLVASHLLKACHYWTDTGEGFFELYYLRNKEKKEIDFLITCDRSPWMAIECKSSGTEISPHFKHFLKYINPKLFVQLVNQPIKRKALKILNKNGSIISAAEMLSYLP